NFRDHGDSHDLNEALFHSCRLDEVVHALGEIAARWPARPLALAGFSLGGNFALRAALQTSRVGIPLAYALAVCPIIDPAAGLFSLEESAPWFYQAYFMHKWRHSLLAKQKAFPQHRYFEMSELKQNLRGLTESLVRRHTDFGSLQQYLDGYSVAADALMAMQIPATILTARDDPVIPVGAFEQLRLHPRSRHDQLHRRLHRGAVQRRGGRDAGRLTPGFSVRATDRAGVSVRCGRSPASVPAAGRVRRAESPGARTTRD